MVVKVMVCSGGVAGSKVAGSKVAGEEHGGRVWRGACQMPWSPPRLEWAANHGECIMAAVEPVVTRASAEARLPATSTR